MLSHIIVGYKVTESQEHSAESVPIKILSFKGLSDITIHLTNLSQQEWGR